MALTAKKVYAILKRQISDMEAKIKTPIIYRGTVATADLLPLNPDIGDMYNIESKSVYGEAGMNVAWNGVVWDTMGAPIDMSLYIKSSELADWVKQQNKPTYTAEEVGALPADTKIPSKTSDLQNDSGFLTKIPDNYLSGTDKTLSVSGKAADAKAVGDKNVELLADISNKLNKNQGSENSGKIAGINESGDIVPMFPVSVDYNEETNCLEFGSDQKMELNQGIGLDSTLTKTGYAADAGVVGEITNSLKEDIDNYYPKKQGAFKCVNMVSNLPDEVIMPSGIEKNILDGVCAINGTSTIDYPNLIIKKTILANHVYLFSVKMKENENTVQTCSLITRIGTKPITRNTLGEYPTQLFENKNYPGYTTFCALFSHNSDADVDFSISFALTKTGKKVAISAKDFIITDVTGLSDTQITEIVKNGMKDGVYYNPGKNVADALSNQVKEDITVETIKRMYPNLNGYWYGKKCLVIGDSTSATEQWQKKLYENLGMSVTTHAKGGIGFLQMVVGSLGYEGNYDNETGNTGVLQPLKASDVYDKDLIIIFGGFNNRGTKLGEITDLYKTDGTGQNTVTGQLQFVLNWIYDLLKGNESYAQNLKCKIVLVTPYCCGKYNYADYDGYSGDKWAGYTLREMCDRIVEIAALNNCSSYNAWENSGIGRHTWTIYSASPTATKEAGSDAAPYPTNADQLHLNNSVGYPHLGDCISAFVSGII